MKARVLTLAVLLFAGIAIVSVSAQASASLSSSTPAVDASFSQSLGTTNLLAEAMAVDRASQNMALDAVAQLMAKGNLSQAASKEALKVLTALAYDGTVHETISGMTVINGYPTVRMEACKLLGKLGGPQSAAILLHVLANDNEPMVLSQAAFELGQLGKNPGNTVSQAIAAAFAREDAVRLDNNLAFASLLAFENLAKVNKGISDPMVFDVISRIEATRYGTTVQEKAAQVMAELRSYN